MYNTNRVRNIELPENLFSNLGDNKDLRPSIIKVHNNELEELIKEYTVEEDVKLTNLSNKKEYRERINRMYDDISELIPVDAEIDNILYFNNYVEKGIVVKPKVTSLKQLWTEYRLIKNEKKRPKHHLKQNHHNINDKEMNNFDDLFEALSLRVSEINDYIDELKEMKTNLNISSTKLEDDKQKLAEEKEKFMTYKKEEESKIKTEKENLKINFDRLQTIINDLDKKLNDINN